MSAPRISVIMTVQEYCGESMDKIERIVLLIRKRCFWLSQYVLPILSFCRWKMHRILNGFA